jgi:pectate lyase
MLDITPYKPILGFASWVRGAPPGSPIQHCTTGDQINAAAKLADGPLFISVEGDISGDNTKDNVIRIQRVKQITIIGDGKSKIRGVGFRTNDAEDIVYAHLDIGQVNEGSKDCIGIEGASRGVVVLHCHLSGSMAKSKDYFDGLVDVKHEASEVCLAYNHFHDHHKAVLIGSSDSDKGNRRVTIVRNFFDDLGSRGPSNRFGEVHIADNYFRGMDTSGINMRMGAVGLIEGNVFEKVKLPICSLDSKEIGRWHQRDNRYIEVQWPKVSGKAVASGQDGQSTTDWEPPYSFIRLPLDQVVAHVTCFAGPLQAGAAGPVIDGRATELPAEPGSNEPEKPVDEPGTDQPGQAETEVVDLAPIVAALDEAEAGLDQYKAALAKVRRLLGAG